MTDIKDLALRVAKEVVLPAKHITFANEIGYGFDGDELADFAKRFLAAYLAEQKPVAWEITETVGNTTQTSITRQGPNSVSDDDKAEFYLHFRPLFYAAPPLPEPAPHQEPVAWAREWEGDVSDIGNMIIEWNKEDCDDNPNWFPLFTVPPFPEPAPMSQVFMVTNRTSCVAFATAEQAHQYIASFSGSIGGGMSITSVPVISEPAPQQQNSKSESGEERQPPHCEGESSGKPVVGAAPSQKEVREMVA